MSTLFVNNLNTASGSTITVPTGKKLIVTDEGGLAVPGTVVQVIPVTGNTTTSVSTTNNTRVGVEASITPKASNSKILVLCNATCRWPHGDAGFTALHRKIGSNSWDEIETFSRHTMYRNFDTGSTNGQHISINYVDSPTTTSAVTYSWAMNRFVSGTAVFLPNYNSGDSQNWALIEIAQ